MKKFALLDLASFLLFGAFFLSLIYELWRDYFVAHCTQPTPLLRISDNRVTTMHENAPSVRGLLCNVVPRAPARRVAHAARRRVHVHHARRQMSFICTTSCVFASHCRPCRSSIASKATLHSRFLALCLFVFAALFQSSRTRSRSNKKRQ
jgi:hypothetical protein